jgi:hypothetical protein
MKLKLPMKIKNWKWGLECRPEAPPKGLHINLTAVTSVYTEEKVEILFITFLAAFC